jgi:hypothetical protein
MIEKLGPLAYSSRTLISAAHGLMLGKKLGAPPKEVEEQGEMRILCPKCRRMAAALDHSWRAKY